MGSFCRCKKRVPPESFDQSLVRARQLALVLEKSGCVVSGFSDGGDVATSIHADFFAANDLGVALLVVVD